MTTTPCVENVMPAPFAASCGAFILRAKAATEAAARGLWNVLKTVGEQGARREMRLLADNIAITRPELAATLRAAVRQSWAQ